jgi:hypothetical protein
LTNGKNEKTALLRVLKQRKSELTAASGSTFVTRNLNSDSNGNIILQKGNDAKILKSAIE